MGDMTERPEVLLTAPSTAEPIPCVFPWLDSKGQVVSAEHLSCPCLTDRPQASQQETRHNAGALSFTDEGSSSALGFHEGNSEHASSKPPHSGTSMHSDEEDYTDVPTAGRRKRKRRAKTKRKHRSGDANKRANKNSRFFRRKFYGSASLLQLEGVSAREYVLSKHWQSVDAPTHPMQTPTGDGVALPDSAKGFTLVDCNPDPTVDPTIIVDSGDLTCLVRTAAGAPFSINRPQKLCGAIEGLLASFSQSGTHDSQAIVSPSIHPDMGSLIEHGASTCQVFFPGIAERYGSVVDPSWYKKTSPSSPPSALFTDAFITGPALKREHCSLGPSLQTTTSDINLVLLLPFSVPGMKYDHSKRSWLCLWEAGVCIELLPWMTVMFPAPLFCRSGIEIEDIQLITTASGEKPVPGMSPGDSQDRGCLFLFNRGEARRPSEAGSKPS